MNVFITGGTGFLGTELVKRLVSESHHVYLLIRNRKKGNSLLETIKIEYHHQINFVEGELTKEKFGLQSNELKKLTNKIDIVFHTAAFLSFDETMRDEIFQVNVEGTRNVLHFASLIECKKFIHVSTAYTLGNRTFGKEELYPLNSQFINSYEESKCHAEHLVMAHHDHFDVSIMRPAIIVGDSVTGEANTTFGLYGVLKAIQLLIRRSDREGKEINVRLVMDKETKSNLVPVDYVINALLVGMYHSKNNTIYHITNSNPPTNELITGVIKNVYDYKSITLINEEDAEILSPLEATINNSLQVFEDYLNRSISFDDSNMQELLQKHKIQSLAMNKEMLNTIINGYESRSLITK